METEEKLIRAALKQFQTHGYMAATTKSIAGEAGVAEVTLFRIFGDKKTLFQRASVYIGEQFGLMRVPTEVSGDLRTDVTRLCYTLLHHFIRQNDIIRMLIFEVRKYEDTRKLLVDIRGKAMENIRTTVEKSGGHAARSCTPACLEWLMNSLIGSSLCAVLFHETEDTDAYVRAHAGMIADAFVNKLETAGK